MNVLLLDGSAWRDKEDFFRSFLEAVKAPEWHGHNLDALRDSIAAGQINGVVPPYSVVIRGARTWPVTLVTFMREVEAIFVEAKASGVAVDWLMLSHSDS